MSVCSANDNTTDSDETLEPIEIEIENFDLNKYLKRYDVKKPAPNKHKYVSAEEAHQAKRRRLDKDNMVADTCSEMALLLQNAKKHFAPPTYNQLFFNSVALQVEEAKLPPMELMRLQQRVLEVITQEIITYQEQALALQS